MSYTTFETIKQSLEDTKEEYLETFFSLVRQKSISAQNIGVQECADLVETLMKDAGIDAKQIETEGNPVVYGEVIHPDNDFTVLFYGHYDVQPPEPLELWETEPFEPTIRDGKIYGRGTGDNKGQFIAHILAVKTLLSLEEKLPINVKFLIEGEEEVGSIHLASFVEKHKDLLEADVAYTSDGPMNGPDQPTVILGNRGLLYVELHAKGAVRDNHSGNKGNIAPNPAMDLVQLLQTMINQEGEVLINGFYDDILIPTEEEKEHLKSLPFDPKETAEIVGLDNLDMTGEEYYANLCLKPTFNIAGFGSGYTGEGSKTIIPSEATVKIDMRLAADQHPEKIFHALKKHVEAFESRSTITVQELGGVKPSRTPLHLEVVQNVIDSVRLAHDKEPLVVPALGGTVPMYVFTDLLKIPSLLIPYANVDENNHSPYENIGVKEFYDGIKTTCAALLTLGKK
jgi:acetylornithine deacetylase/succinyl-diaminopimelate desuccinylase-like protein